MITTLLTFRPPKNVEKKTSNDAINELGGLNKNQLKRLLLNLKHEKNQL